MIVVGFGLIMKRNLLQLWGVRCLLGCFGLAFGFTASAEKAWKSPTSGFWADGTNWSGGLPPDITAFIQITNANTKTVTIDAATPAATLTVQMLTMSAPPGQTNTLLLSDAGTNNPLVFQTGLQLDDGAAIRITNSALVVEIPFFHVDLDGSLTLDSGWLTFSDNTSTARVGRATSGRLSINGGAVQAGTMTVGGLTNSQGMVSMTGGLLDISSLFSIGRNPGTTGTVAVLGGQLSVPNDDTRIGDSGVGQMIVSNATATLSNLVVGHSSLSVGLLTLQNNGTILLSNDLSIGRFGGSTGSVTVAGGELIASGLKIYVGREGAGQMTVAGGSVQASRLWVAANPTNTVSGNFSMSGGNLSLSSELLVGSLSLATGEVLITGGAITATNSTGAGDVSVPSGNLTLSGGTITTDSLLLTNSAGRMVFNGGVLSTRGTTVANGSPFVVGDGNSAATFNLLGGTHSFANGLIISSNANLTGCGTIIGSIINHGTISTNCGGGTVPPSITVQPVSLTVTQGNNATFSVTATGDPPLSYQWRFGGNNLSAATSSSYTVTGAQAANAGNYDVVVSNNSGSVTSAVATLTVRIPPSITQPPVSLTVTQGNNASFSVTATGDAPLSYQWRFGGNNLSGATSSSYTVIGAQAANAGNYDVVVSNNSGSVTSAVATLTVRIPPSITQQPVSLTVTQGNNATFSVTAAGDVPLTYQWRFGGNNLSGATSSGYTVTSAQAANAGNYDVVVSNNSGSVTSAVATLTVRIPPFITQQPVSLTVTQGNTATFSVTAMGDPPLSYQWRFGGNNLSGATSSGYTVISAQAVNAGNYDVVVSNNSGSVTSSVATLTVRIPPSITQQPVSLTVTQGDNASFSVTATGDPPLSYQWRFGGNNLSGATSTGYTVTSAQAANAGNYDVVVSNNSGSVTSAVATLLVLGPPSITMQPVSLTVTQGNNASFSVTATGDPPLSYQWRFGGNNLSAATSSSYTVTGAQAANAGNYDVVVSNNSGSVTSAVAT